MNRPRIRVVAGVIERGGRILIAQRGGEGPFAGKWEFPGGKVKKGETDLEAVAREVKEELGIDVRLNRVIGETTYDYDSLSVRIIFISGRWGGEGSIRATDHQRLEWVLPADLIKFDFLEADVPILPTIARLRRTPESF